MYTTDQIDIVLYANSSSVGYIISDMDWNKQHF